MHMADLTLTYHQGRARLLTVVKKVTIIDKAILKSIIDLGPLHNTCRQNIVLIKCGLICLVNALNPGKKTKLWSPFVICLQISTVIPTHINQNQSGLAVLVSCQ